MHASKRLHACALAAFTSCLPPCTDRHASQPSGLGPGCGLTNAPEGAQLGPWVVLGGGGVQGPAIGGAQRHHHILVNGRPAAVPVGRGMMMATQLGGGGWVWHGRSPGMATARDASSTHALCQWPGSSIHLFILRPVSS